jgi:hypothetical protein
MSTLLSRLNRFNPFAIAAPQPVAGDVAQNLMERAEATAGRNPLQSRELRGAAQAYLRVVR